MAAQPVSAQIVGNAFVQQYYQILHSSPALVYRFYQDISTLGRPDEDGTMTFTTTMKGINEKIMSLNYGEFKAEIKSIDAQDSFNMGVLVLVTGYLTGKDNMIRDFAQTFFLAPQDRGGYFVLNDIFRYVEKVKHPDAHHVSVEIGEVPLPSEQGPLEVALVQKDHISDKINVLEEKGSEEEVQCPSENGGISTVNEELQVPVTVELIPQPTEVVEVVVPAIKVVDEVPDDWHTVEKINGKKDEMPKKSFASIVIELKDKALPFSSLPPVQRKTSPRSGKQGNPALTLLAEASLDATENGINPNGEANEYSIYIKGLPFNATPSLLEDEFKKFGTIKSGGVQVRSKQGFCFGFVEFEEASAVEKAIEASPITIGGRNAVVEEKKSTSSRGNTRGRFPAGKGPGFRIESNRGRGNYGSGRAYSRGDSNSRIDYSRGNTRGGSSSRGTDGYQRDENVGTNGSRFNRFNGLTGGGPAKNLAPRVSATA